MDIKECNISFWWDHYVADIIIEYQGKTHSLITDGKTLDTLFVRIQDALECSFGNEWVTYFTSHSLSVSTIQLYFSNNYASYA